MNKKFIEKIPLLAVVLCYLFYAQYLVSVYTFALILYKLNTLQKYFFACLYCVSAYF